MSIQVGANWGGKPNTMLIPFDGFYESLWDRAIEDEEQNAAEWLVKAFQQDDARLKNVSYARVLHALEDELNVNQIRHAIAKDYAERFGEWLKSELALDDEGFNIAFERLDSPREYNFRTDWVFVEIPPYACQRLWNKTDKDVLFDTILEHHTPRPGFFSHYSTSVCDWENRPGFRLDHNELFTVLCAWMRSEGHDADDVEQRMCEDMTCNGVIHNIVNAAYDQEAVRQRLFKQTLLSPLAA